MSNNKSAIDSNKVSFSLRRTKQGFQASAWKPCLLCSILHVLINQMPIIKHGRGILFLFSGLIFGYFFTWKKDIFPTVIGLITIYLYLIGPLSPSSKEIIVLRAFGVITEHNKDEFDTLGFGRYRYTQYWTKSGDRSPTNG